MPDALKIKSPSTFSYWSVFKEFEALRNNIVHVKKEVLINPDESEKLIGALLDESVFKKIKAGRDLVDDLTKSLPSHYEFPILKNFGRFDTD